MKNQLSEFIKDESGQGMVEYTFIVALIAIVVMVGFFAIGNEAKISLEDSSTKIGAI